MAHRELSGILTGPDKWQSTLEQVAAPDCAIEQLRVYHNTPEQLAATVGALDSNISVRALDVGVAEGDGCLALAELLKANSSITSLTIQKLGPQETQQDATGQQQDAAILATALQSNSYIQQLTLQQLQPESVVVLVDALQQQGNRGCGRLQQLYLPETRLTSAAAAALRSALLSQPALTYLSLQSAVFVTADPAAGSSSSNACAELFTTTLAAHPGLTNLDLHNTKGLNTGAVGSYLAAAQQLQEVILRGCLLGDPAGQQLADAMIQQQQQAGLGLRVLDLSHTAIGAAGAAALGRALGLLCRQLTDLDLSHNALGAEGVSALVAGLAGSSSGIAMLNLEGNGIKGSEGLVSLLHSPAGQHLTTLNLSNNCLNDEAAAQLATAISSSTSLTALNLSSNWIGDDGAKALAKTLKNHKTLSTLQLQKNRIKRAGIETLADATLANPLVDNLGVEGNRAIDRLSKMSIDDLRRALTERRKHPVTSRRTSFTNSRQPDQANNNSSSLGASAVAAVASSSSSSGGPGSPLKRRGPSYSFASAAAAAAPFGNCIDDDWDDVCAARPAAGFGSVGFGGRGAKMARLENSSWPFARAVSGALAAFGNTEQPISFVPFSAAGGSNTAVPEGPCLDGLFSNLVANAAWEAGDGEISLSVSRGSTAGDSQTPRQSILDASKRSSLDALEGTVSSSCLRPNIGVVIDRLLTMRRLHSCSLADWGEELGNSVIVAALDAAAAADVSGATTATGAAAGSINNTARIDECWSDEPGSASPKGSRQVSIDAKAAFLPALATEMFASVEGVPSLSGWGIEDALAQQLMLSGLIKPDDIMHSSSGVMGNGVSKLNKTSSSSSLTALLAGSSSGSVSSSAAASGDGSKQLISNSNIASGTTATALQELPNGLLASTSSGEKSAGMQQPAAATAAAPAPAKGHKLSRLSRA